MYKAFLQKIGVADLKDETLRLAFTHRSYVNEHRAEGEEHNERLEFLGDACLELVVTDFLYKNYPHSEGELTNWRSALVKRETLAQAAAELDLGSFLRLSRGEEVSGGREKEYLLANTFEALIGAIYIDCGLEGARQFIERFLISKLDNVLEQGLHIDAKSHFQELAQAEARVTPVYRLLSEDGPDHSKMFVMGAYLKDQLVGQGSGNSKQAAEQAAARDALAQKEWQ